MTPALERIVACATLFKDGTKGIGLNHGDILGGKAERQRRDLDDVFNDIEAEGFFTSKARFVSREEALDIAKAAGQYRPVPGEENEWLDYQNVWDDKHFMTSAAVALFKRHERGRQAEALVGALLDSRAKDFIKSLPPPSKIDFSIEDHGSIVLIRPLNPVGAQWLKDTAPEEAQFYGGALVVEPRYVGGVLQAIDDAGLSTDVS
jgi:hypothetical protein